MSKLFILGDSNVYRNVLAGKLAARVGLPVTLLNSTRQLTLELGLKEASDSDSDVLVVSCLENLLRDATVGKLESQLSDTILSTISDYVKLVALNSSNFSKVLMVNPLFRMEPKWFPDYFQTIREALSSHIEMYPCMHLMPIFRVVDEDLEADGIHLNTNTGGKFFEHIVSCVKDLGMLDTTEIFHSPPETLRHSSSIVNLDREPSNADLMTYLRTDIVKRLDDLTGVRDKIVSIEKKTNIRAREDDFIFASMRDDLDQVANDKCADRLVVTGLKVPEDFPSSLSDQKVALAQFLRPFVENFLGVVVFDLYMKNTPSGAKFVTPFDLRFTTVKTCQDFKKRAFKEIKGEEETKKYGKPEFHPKLVLGSRVRLEILRAISKKMLASEESGYCPIFSNRPILHVGKMVDGKVKQEETLTFSEAVERYESLLTYPDLYFAYQRVGRAFKGKLRQYFIVLSEDGRTKFFNEASKSSSFHGVGRGTKRKMPESVTRGGKRTR